MKNLTPLLLLLLSPLSAFSQATPPEPGFMDYGYLRDRTQQYSYESRPISALSPDGRIRIKRVEVRFTKAGAEVWLADCRILFRDSLRAPLELLKDLPRDLSFGSFNYVSDSTNSRDWANRLSFFRAPIDQFPIEAIECRVPRTLHASQGYLKDTAIVIGDAMTGKFGLAADLFFRE